MRNATVVFFAALVWPFILSGVQAQAVQNRFTTSVTSNDQGHVSAQPGNNSALQSVHNAGIPLDGPAAIQAFVEAGGKFNDDFGWDGLTAAMNTLVGDGKNSPDPQTPAAFIKAGGYYTNRQDDLGRTAGIIAVQNGSDIIRAFAAAGGRFTDQQDINGKTARDWAAEGEFDAHQSNSGKDDESNDLNLEGKPNPLLVAYDKAVADQKGLDFTRAGQLQAGEVLDCSRPELDTTMQIADTADHYRTISFYFRNMTDHPCLLRYRPVLEMGSIGDITGTGRVVPSLQHSPFTLASSKTAHLSFRFLRETAPGSSVCKEDSYMWGYMLPEKMNNHSNAELHNLHINQAFFVLNVPKLRMTVCSPAETNWYVDNPGNLAPEKSTSDSQLRLWQDEKTYFASKPNAYYVSDSVRLHLEATLPDEPLSLENKKSSQDSACSKPIFLQRTRYHNGTVLYEELSQSKQFQNMKCIAKPGDNGQEKLTVDFDDQNNDMMNQIGNGTLDSLDDRTIDIQSISKIGGAWKNLATSNSLVLHTQDVMTLPRVWGAQMKGFAVSLTTDRDTYKVGESIRLHLACTRFTSGWTVSGGDFFIHLCDPDFEIRDSKGQPVQLAEQHDLGTGSFTMCGMESGSSGPDVTYKMAKGDVIPEEKMLDNRTCLGDGGFFISKPGTYTLTAIWHASDDGLFSSGDTDAKSMPVTFTIAP